MTFPSRAQALREQQTLQALACAWWRHSARDQLAPLGQAARATVMSSLTPAEEARAAQSGWWKVLDVRFLMHQQKRGSYYDFTESCRSSTEF